MIELKDFTFWYLEDYLINIELKELIQEIKKSIQ